MPKYSAHLACVRWWSCRISLSFTFHLIPIIPCCREKINLSRCHFGTFLKHSAILAPYNHLLYKTKTERIGSTRSNVPLLRPLFSRRPIMDPPRIPLFFQAVDSNLRTLLFFSFLNHRKTLAVMDKLAGIPSEYKNRRKINRPHPTNSLWFRRKNRQAGWLPKPSVRFCQAPILRLQIGWSLRREQAAFGSCHAPGVILLSAR